jgi:hypothetical protein
VEEKGIEQRIVRLSRDDDGTEIWLDTRTGQQLTGVVEREELPAPHPLIANVTVVFDNFKWRWQLIGTQCVCSAVRGEHASYGVCFRAGDDPPALYCTVELPMPVPENQRARAVDYLNRVNWVLHFGNFELDPRDGQMRFRAMIDVTGATMVPELVGRTVASALSLCERYFPGLMGVVFGGVEPADALASASTRGD